MCASQPCTIQRPTMVKVLKMAATEYLRQRQQHAPAIVTRFKMAVIVPLVLEPVTTALVYFMGRLPARP